MNTESTERYEEHLRKIIDEVTHYLWDPIGIAGTPETRNEYHGHISGIQILLAGNESEETIANHLNELQTQRIGMKSDKEKCIKIAEILIGWKNYLYAKYQK